MTQITSRFLKLALLQPENGFILDSTMFEGTSLQGQFSLDGQISGKPLTLSGELQRIWQESDLDHPVSPLEVTACLGIDLPTNFPEVMVRIRLGLLEHKAFSILRMDLINSSNTALRVNRFTLLSAQPGQIKFANMTPQKPAFYSNGWQSWSATGACTLGEKQPHSRLGPFQNPMVINPGTPLTKHRNHFSSDMFGVLADLDSRIGLLAGFLSQKEQFGSLETCFELAPTLNLWANGDHAIVPAGETMQTDWAVLGFMNIDVQDPLGPYLSSAAEVHGVRSEASVPVGWCSWYHFYQDINEEAIDANLQSVVNLKPEIPLPLFQVDDGFETYPGDWFDFNPGFPNGLKPIVQKTDKEGLTPGVWLAPFIVHPKAKLVKAHPDWLLRDRRGKPVSAGFVWNRFNYALDLTHPEALAYAREVIRTAVQDWGFAYLKLDFLYAAALNSVFKDRTKTRAQVMRMGLEALREAAGPETTLLGCGCPLGSGLGIFDAMRIGADVSGYWKPHYPPFSIVMKGEPHMPSAQNALHNILTRSSLHRHWWINDPDCLLIRPETDLTLVEVQTLATAIGLTGGSLLLSDNLPGLPPERLRIAQTLLPVMDQRAWVIDWMDHAMPSKIRLDLESSVGQWSLLAQFNWGDEPTSLAFSPRDFNLPVEETWWVSEFWSGASGKMNSNSPFITPGVPEHGVRVLAIRPFVDGQSAYLGSSLHLSQGMEVSRWEIQKNEVTLQVMLNHQASGEVYLYFPREPLKAITEKGLLNLKYRGRGIYSIFLPDFEGKTIRIKY